MELPGNLQKRICDFLISLPNLQDAESQRAFIYNAGLDSQLQSQIPFGKPPIQFVPSLLVILTNYGKLSDERYALEAVLEIAKNYVGRDKQEYCTTLLHEVRNFRELSSTQNGENDSPEISPEPRIVVNDTHTDTANGRTNSPWKLPFFVGVLLLLCVIGILAVYILNERSTLYTAGLKHSENKAYLFAGDKYYRFDFTKDEVEKVGTIGVDGWKGVPAGIEAAFKYSNGKIYFFIGDKYYRFDSGKDIVDKTGTIGVDGWKGLPAKIDAALMHSSGKVYFFSGNTYYRWVSETGKVDKKGIIGIDGWKGVPAGIDVAIEHPNGKWYFFVDDKYYRFDSGKDNVDKTGTIGVDGWKGF